MTTVIEILCFIVAFFTNSFELPYPHKEGAIHPTPIQLYNVHNFEYKNPVHLDRQGSIQTLHPRNYTMATDERREFIIGLFLPELGTLHPLMAGRADLGNKLGCVKIRIDGQIANMTAPMSRHDQVFLESFIPQHIVNVEVHGPARYDGLLQK